MKNNSQHRIGYNRWLMILTCLMFASASSFSQSISWTFVNAAGFEDGDNASLRWTMGEPLTLEVSGVSGSLRVGFMPFAYYEEVISSYMTIDPDIEISISPNPASDDLYVQVPQNNGYILRILSMDGRAHIAGEINHTTRIDIRSLPAGTYVLYIMNPAGTYNSKTFIKS